MQRKANCTHVYNSLSEVDQAVEVEMAELQRILTALAELRGRLRQEIADTQRMTQECTERTAAMVRLRRQNRASSLN